MKTQVVTSSQATSASTDRAQFAIMDLIRMLAAAAVCGIVFSLFAAGLTLLLMNSAEAHNLNLKNSTVEGSALTSTTESINRCARPSGAVKAMSSVKLNPGQLVTGLGCDQETLEAIERDWRIRINDDVAEVRIMQTFLIPVNGPTTANFHASLPDGAVLSSLKFDAGAITQTGEPVTLEVFTNMSRADIGAIHNRSRLVVVINDRHIESDSILNLTPGETVTIEYNYTMSVLHINNSANLNMVLQAETLSSYAASTITVGTVWVEWLNQHPRKVTSALNDIYVDQTSNGVAGASWFSADLSASRQFNIQWDRKSPVLNKSR